MARYFRRRKFCRFTSEGVTEIDYKDIDLLTLYVTEQGKILPRRLTGLKSKQQKKVTKLIKQARIAALLPFVIGKN